MGRLNGLLRLLSAVTMFDCPLMCFFLFCSAFCCKVEFRRLIVKSVPNYLFSINEHFLTLRFFRWTLTFKTLNPVPFFFALVWYLIQTWEVKPEIGIYDTVQLFAIYLILSPDSKAISLFPFLS